MRDFFHSLKFKILIAFTALIIGVMIYSITTGGYSVGSEYLFELIFEPIKTLSTNISTKVSTSFDMVINAEKYYTENQQLKEQLNEYYNDMVEYDRILQENEQLRTMLDLKSEYTDYGFSSPCTIIARTTNDPYASFTIDHGSEDGIEVNDPVVTENGIVGVCYEVSANTSKVRTLYSPKTAIGVYSVRTKAEGICEGSYELAQNGRIKMSYIDINADIEEGDIIVTSGSTNYPAGQLIGTVEAVYTESSGLSKYAIIIPIEDPKTITRDNVITNYTLDEVTAIKIGEASDGDAD